MALSVKPKVQYLFDLRASCSHVQTTGWLERQRDSHEVVARLAHNISKEKFLGAAEKAFRNVLTCQDRLSNKKHPV